MTHPTPALGPVEIDFTAARRKYLEFYGAVLVMNSYLKIAVLALCLSNISLALLANQIYRHFQNLPSVVTRIGPDGRTEVVKDGVSEYHPQDVEIKYFLVQFVQQFYGRMHATIRNDYPRAMYFLEPGLANGIMAANKKSKFVETFLQSGQDDVDIHVTNVAIEDLQKAPYRAVVEFERVYTTTTDHRETHRDRCTVHVFFVVRQPVANALVPFNPLGFTITYFRLDQAF